jgi:DNA polymerase III delta prime subunit
VVREIGGRHGAAGAAVVRKGASIMDILAAAEAIARAQPRVGPLLEGLAASGKLPPSLVFAGPEGAGKELMAVKLAAELNCEGRGPEGACGAGGRCEACAKIRTLEHPDLHLIYPVPHGEIDTGLPLVLDSRREDFFARGEFGTRGRSVGIDLVRLVIEALSKHPFEGKRSVVAIFEAHLATTEAQNALLKLLEEPPPSAAIVLVTEYPDRLLPTIRSRCGEIRFDPLAAGAIAGFLEEFYSVEKEEAKRLAALAQGNLRRGINLLEERFLGLWKDAAAVVGLVVDGKSKELIAEAEELAGYSEARRRNRGYSREDIAELLEEMTILFGLLIRNRDGRLSATEKGVLDDAIGAGRLAATAARDLPGDINKISAAIESLRRNADMELTLSHLFLDLTHAWY